MKYSDVFLFIEASEFINCDTNSVIYININKVGMSGNHTVFEAWFKSLNFSCFQILQANCGAEDYFDNIQLFGGADCLYEEVTKLDRALNRLKEFNTQRRLLDMSKDYWIEEY